MSSFFKFAEHLDQRGFRWLVARAATVAWGRRHGQRFSVAADGSWVNGQAEATIVSPTIHTTSYDAFRAWVLDNWCWGYCPQPGDTVVDVGAGVGEEAVIFSRLVGPSGRVFSIEAHPGTFACLEQTVSLSGLTNVTPLLLALGDREGEISIGTGNAHLKNSIMVGGDGGSMVPMRTLCDVLDRHGIANVDLLKINIEGAERLAVRGQQACAGRIRHAVISCHDFLAERGDGETLRTREEVRAMLLEQGFKLTTRPEHQDEWVRDYLYGSGDGQAA